MAARPSLRLVLSFAGLILFVMGCVLLLFPHLPATTADGSRFPDPHIPLKLSLGLLFAGLAVLLGTRGK
jgi:hypothetical protein